MYIDWIDPATLWCNGSTTGFGPVSSGSNPGGVAIFFTWGGDMKRDPAAENLKLVCLCEGTAEKLVITPRIEAKGVLDSTLIASFHIDSLEMASSARIVLKGNDPSALFPGRAAIHRPLFWFPRNMGSPAFYTFKAQFFKEAKEDFSITEKRGFSLADGEYKDGKYLFTLQGKPLSLQKFSTICETPQELKKALSSDRKGNFFLLPQEPEMWEGFLSLCDLYGITAGALLPEGENFSTLSGELFHHPSFLFLFSPDLKEGELMKHSISPLGQSLTLPMSLLFTL